MFFGGICLWTNMSLDKYDFFHSNLSLEEYVFQRDLSLEEYVFGGICLWRN